ncbi:hypothetical protein BDV06DRAFT_198938 [Aspergillus oleicola]
MSPSNSRKSRNNGIPAHLIKNWQAADGHGAKPAVRRPLTACDTCRNAKVRCKGKHDSCDRCMARGIRCKFSALPHTTPRAATNFDTSSASDLQEPSHVAVSLPNGNQVSTSAPVEQSDDTGMTGLDDPVLNPGPISTMVDWSREIPSQLFDWPSLDLEQYTIEPFMSVPGNELEFSHQPTEPPQLSNNSSTSSATADDSGSKFSCDLHRRQQAQGACQCRADLMAQVPKVKDAMQKPSPQLDQILNVTFKVLFVCRNLIVCTKCQISYADLVCVVAVLQQTETGLEHIAEEGLTDNNNVSTIKISMGDYDVPFGNQATLRHALIMDLVATANCLLEKLRLRSEGLAEKEAQSVSTAQSRLTRINMNYLQEVVKSFESTLRSIANSLEGSPK